MNKEIYNKEWAKLDSKYRRKVESINERLEKLKEQQTNFKYGFSTKVGIGVIVLSIVALIIVFMAGGSAGAAFITGIGVFGGLSLIWFALYRVINKDLISYNKAFIGDKILRNKLGNELQELSEKDREDKYLLATQYSNVYLNSVNVFKDFDASFKISSAIFGRKYNKGTKKYESEELLIKYDDTIVSTLNNNQVWNDQRSEDLFILREVQMKYRNSKILITPSTTEPIATFTSTKKSRNLKTLEVLNPSFSNKRHWPRAVAELNGDYYPNVSRSSEDIEVFKFFTPRIIDFFLTNQNGDMVKAIEKNSIVFNDLETGFEWFSIPSSWGVREPDDIIKEIETFAIYHTHRGINLNWVLKTLEDTDTLHR